MKAYKELRALQKAIGELESAALTFPAPEKIEKLVADVVIAKWTWLEARNA